jgi:hypothetical protein
MEKIVTANNTSGRTNEIAPRSQKTRNTAKVIAYDFDA